LPYLIKKTKEFAAIRANLKLPVVSNHADLDVRKSVAATIKSAGFPSLVFNNEWEERRYLLLIDNRAPEAHIGHLWAYLFHFLESTGVRIRKYYYTDDIMIVKDTNGNTIQLSDLAYNFSSQYLVIFGDCRSFFNNNFRFSKDMSRAFQKWNAKAIITPFPLADWSHSETQLQKNSFQLVPSEIGAIDILCRSIAEDTAISPALLSNRVKDKYSMMRHEFKTADDIKNYLGNEQLFQVICALAVYPRLDWNITLALFNAIGSENQNASPGLVPDYDSILKIARIPWLHGRQFTKAMRLQLLDHLKPGTEIIARKTIIELLNGAEPFVIKNSPADKELQLQVMINSFFLYAHDQQQYKQYADVKRDFINYWRDLKEFSLKERTKNGLMPLNSQGQAKTVEEFLLQEQQFEKHNVTLLRVALLTLPAALLYLMFTIIRPGFVYLDSYNKVSFVAMINKSSDCKDLSQIVVGKMDRFDTVPVRNYNGINYIQIENTTYDRPVHLWFRFSDSTTVELPVDARDSTAVVSLICP
jgi:hypothetical protein